MLDDAVARARLGDEAAFAALWRWLQPGLLRSLAATEPGHAEDVAGEVWVDVARGISTFEGTATAFRSWVFTLARRRAVDAGRRRSRRVRSVPLHDLEAPVDDDSATAMVARQSLEAALAMVAALPPDQAEVVTLRVIGELTVTEVAAVVGKSEGAVRALSHRGLRALARRLATTDAARGRNAEPPVSALYGDEADRGR